LKCDKCGYVSYDYNHDCPVCGKDLAVTRGRLGIHFDPPEADFDDLFTGQSGSYTTVARTQQAKPRETEPELDLDSVGDEFECTLDD